MPHHAWTLSRVHGARAPSSSTLDEMKLTRIAWLCSSCTLALSASADAQNVSTLVLEGDVVPGVGAVTRIDNLALSAGSWLVEADTDQADTEADSVVLFDGALYLREGQALPAPAGSTLDSFDAITINSNGNTSHNFFLDGTTGGSDDSGVYWNDLLLIQEGDLSTAPGLSAGTPYIGFFETRINASETILVIASIDDPAIASTVDRALILVTTDGAGNVLAESVVAKEGDLAGSLNSPITDFGTGPHEFAFNDAGQVMYSADLSTGSSTNDVAVYLDATLLAEEAAPSPIAGRNWRLLSSSEMGLNNNGDWVLSGTLDGDTATDSVIVTNTGVIAQEGDSLPGMNGFALTSFGSGPVEIADNGDVLWYGDWNDPDTDIDTGLWINQTLIVQEGVTTVNGIAIDSISGVQDGYHLDPSGLFVIFEGTLANGLDGAFWLPLTGPGTPYCFGDGSGPACPCGNAGGAGEGCANSTGGGAVLSASGTTSVSADDITFHVSGVGANKPCLLFSGTSVNSAQFGDGILCVTGGITRHEIAITDGNGDATWGPGQIFNANWSNGDLRNFQIWYRDPTGPCSSLFNTSNGLEITFAP